jgi:hypothetical protein
MVSLCWFINKKDLVKAFSPPDLKIMSHPIYSSLAMNEQSQGYNPLGPHGEKCRCHVKLMYSAIIGYKVELRQKVSF